MTGSVRSLTESLNDQFTPVPDDVCARWRDQGMWTGEPLRSLLTVAAERHPKRIGLVGWSESGRRQTKSYEEYDRAATSAANRLGSLGVGPGDSVVIMLPNGLAFAEILFGVLQLGAVYSGIPAAYGPRQLGSVLDRTKAKVLVIPARWRSADHLRMSRDVRESLTTLEHVVVVGEAAPGITLRAGEIAWDEVDDEVVAPNHEVDPQALCYLGFTSGTTGSPKGAMHNHETLSYAVREQVTHVGREAFGNQFVQLVASPVGHHTGFVWGLLMTTHLAGTAVLLDRWDPRRASEVIRAEAVTTFFGAPTFLQDLLQTDLVDDPSCPLTCMVIAGAPVPAGLIRRAAQAFNAFVAPAWGMTECSIVSCAVPDRDDLLDTDGTIIRGSEVRVVDDAGSPSGGGVVGHLQVRGPGVTLGYFDLPEETAHAFRPGLWLDTGDMASLVEGGALRLMGRSKDIVIRGGENVPVIEVEGLVLDHPDVVAVSVVGVPDDRLGEAVCAAVVLRPQAPQMTVTSLTTYLKERGLSVHYLPERVVVLDELPTTPSGKVRKVDVRRMVLG